MHRATLGITILLTIVLAGLSLAYLFRPFGWLCAYDLPGGRRIELYCSRYWEHACPIHAMLYDHGRAVVNMGQVEDSNVLPVPTDYVVCLFDDQSDTVLLVDRPRWQTYTWAKLRGNLGLVHRFGTDATYLPGQDFNAAFDLIETVPRGAARNSAPLVL